MFHILPIEKLPSVIEHGLLCDVRAHDLLGNQQATDAAHAFLKDDRRRTTVPVACGGAMTDYVPFYFGPRSPMLYSIMRGNTEYGRNGRGQAGMLHLTCRLEALAREAPGAWCFIDNHFTRAWAQFGESLAEMDRRVDFDVMRARKWDEPDKVKAARQAEFLVHAVVPWEYVELIVVMDADIAEEVRTLIRSSGTGHLPPVHPRPPKPRGEYAGSAFPHGYYYEERGRAR